MSKTILVVEDDKSVQRMLGELLEDEGFVVIGERDGEWALKTFESRDVDFVVLDVLVPVLSGFQVAEEIRKMAKGEHTPILMISGVYKGENHRKEAISKYGVVDYLDKPIKADVLVEILRDVFGADYPSAVATQAAREELNQKPPDLFASSESRKEKREVEEDMGTFRGSSRRGSLADVSFPQLLVQMAREKVAGALLLKKDKVKKIVYFKNGHPVFVKSNLLNECLGKLMVREKMITEPECEASIKRMRESKRQQGTCLIEMGCISPHNLQYALEMQLAEKLFDLFAWEVGDFQFNPKSPVPPVTVTLDGSCAALVYEGVRKKMDGTRLTSIMDPYLDRYVVPHPDPLFRFQDMELDEEEERFVAQLKGDKTFREIQDLGLNKQRVCQILYSLMTTEMIQLKKERPKDAAEEAHPPALPKKPKKTVKSRLTNHGGVPVPELTRRKGGTLSPEERGLKEELAREVVTLRGMNFFEVLGVSKQVQRVEVKKAYFGMAKKYHPDRLFANASPEIRKLADEIFDIISSAYDVLGEDESRQRYLQDLRSLPKTDVSTSVSRILEAEAKFQKGEVALNKKNYPNALDLFQEAVNLCPEEGEFCAYLGWAMFQSNPQDEQVVREAKENINLAISLNPKTDKAYLFLGYIYKAMGVQDMAEHEFEKAIQCNPDCTEALRELRLISMGRSSDKGKKRRLFGKKK